MGKKLTLNIEEKVIEEAKKYASKKRKSLSRVIQDYLRYVVEMENEDEEIELSPTVRQLLGSVKMKEKEPKDARFEYLKEKYLGT